MKIFSDKCFLLHHRSYVQLMNLLKTIRGSFYSLLNIGIDAEHDTVGKIYIQIANTFCMCGIIMPLIGVAAQVNGEYPSNLYAAIGASIISILSSIALYFNSTKQYNKANYIILLGLSTAQFSHIKLFEVIPSGSEYTFLPMAMLAPFLIKNKWISLSIMSYILALFIITINGRNHSFNVSIVFNIVMVLAGVMISLYAVINHLTAIAYEFKGYNIQLKKQNKKQEELITQNNLKTELLGILSHDLKGPANAFNKLSKKVSFLLKEENYDELEEFGTYFEHAGDKIFKEIDRLLNWTIAQKKNIIIHETELFIHRLIQGICEGLSYQVKDKSVIFENKISNDFKITTDGHLLEIILKNLITNAANHIDHNEKVSMAMTADGEKVHIHIANPGKPISMDIVEQAKAGRYRKSEHGYGLGLGICFSLIEFLQGSIDFTSRSEQGTTATVTLPIKYSLKRQ